MTEKHRHPRILKEISLCEPEDLRTALQRALPGKASGQLDLATNIETASAHAIHAAVRAQLKRLADPQMTELDGLERQLKAITDRTRLLVEAFSAELAVDDAVITQVARITSVQTPPTALVSAIESGARAAGHDDPTQALNEALRQAANLNLWAAAAARAFRAGRSARERAERALRGETDHRTPVGAALLALSGTIEHPPKNGQRRGRPSTTPAHAGRDLGLVVIATYAALTGRPVRVSRRNSTKSQRGGEVTGPLVRFTLTAYEQIRNRLGREPTLEPFGSARAFNPTSATIAAWAQEYNLNTILNG